MDGSFDAGASRLGAAGGYLNAEIADRAPLEIRCYTSADDKAAAGGYLELNKSVVVVFSHFYDAALVSDALVHFLLSFAHAHIYHREEILQLRSHQKCSEIFVFVDGCCMTF